MKTPLLLATRIVILILALLASFTSLNANDFELADTIKLEKRVNDAEKKIGSQETEIGKNRRRTGNNNVRIKNDSIRANTIDKRLDSLSDTIVIIHDDIDNIHNEITNIYVSKGITKKHLDRFWILLAAAIVFLMQAGFNSFEAGLVSQKHRGGIGLKNVMDFVIVAICFYFVGFEWMFNISVNELEKNLFESTGTGHAYGPEFFLFQLAFAATATTIISGALSGRTRIIHYFIVAAAMGAIIYPIFGSMVWGNIINPNGEASLAKEGFMDFAGSSVVHSIGGWVALVGIIFVHKRYNRSFEDLHNTGLSASDLSYSALGVLILWFGWWGFNGGSSLVFDEKVSMVIINTNLAGAAGSLSSFLSGFLLYIVGTTVPTGKFAIKGNKTQAQETVFVKTLGGALGGLVAITACCNVVTSGQAIAIGILAGLLHNLFFNLMIFAKWDDPVGAVPVHAICGVFGTLCVGFFGNPHSFSKNMDAYDNFLHQVYAIPDSNSNMLLSDIKDLSWSIPLSSLNESKKATKVAEINGVLDGILKRNHTQIDQFDFRKSSNYELKELPIQITDFNTDKLPTSRGDQIKIQGKGAIWAFGIAIISAVILFTLLSFIGLRITDQELQREGDILWFEMLKRKKQN